MTHLTLLYLIPSFLLLGQSSNGQSNNINIISSFDSIVFNPDSTIKFAYKINKGLYESYAIEFDTLNIPKAIGKYKKGKKKGNWLYTNGSYSIYQNGQTDYLLIPGCGTGKHKAKEEFQNLYLHLINPKNKNNKKHNLQKMHLRQLIISLTILVFLTVRLSAFRSTKSQVDNATVTKYDNKYLVIITNKRV